MDTQRASSSLAGTACIGLSYTGHSRTTRGCNLGRRRATLDNEPALPRPSFGFTNSRSHGAASSRIRESITKSSRSRVGSLFGARPYPRRIRLRGGSRSMPWSDGARSPRCPKCDEPVAHGEQRCWYCGVDLHDSESTKVCPTCGTPVQISQAIHAYLKTVRRP